MKRAKRIILYFLCLIVLVTWAQTYDRWDKGSGLTGVEKASEPEPFTTDGFLRGLYQRDVENYMMRKIGIRRKMVKLDNQINFSLFGYFQNRAIILGMDNCLYERSYLESYNLLDYEETEQLRKDAQQISRLQQLLKARGKGFVYFIAPSKIQTYPEGLPAGIIDHEARSARQGNYERFVPLLQEYGVTLVDGQALMLSARDEYPYPVFPKSGTHWSHAASVLFVQNLVSRAEGDMGGTLVHIISNGVVVSADPKDSIDADLANLSNLLWPNSLYDSQYYYLKLGTDDAGGTALRPSVLWVGDSYSWQPLHHLGTQRVFSDILFYYYFKRRFDMTGGSKVDMGPIDQDTYDITDDLMKHDIIVIGFSLPYITRHRDLIQAVIKSLEAQ